MGLLLLGVLRSSGAAAGREPGRIRVTRGGGEPVRAIRTCGPDAERGRGIAALAALILVAALAVAWTVAVLPQPAQAQTSSTLVSNTGQTDGAKQFLTVDLALPFTTGTNTGGYRLTSVDIEGGFDTSTGTVDPTFTVGIHSGSGTSVGASVGSLTSSGFTSGTNSFTSSSGIDLDANTSYFVVFDLTASGDKDPWIRTTASNDEDSGASAGWTIGNRITARDLTSTSWSLSSTTNVVEMSIKGLPRLSLTVSPSSLTESAVSTKVTVTATVGTAPAANLTVTLSEDGASTATSGTDYTALGTLASITIASGSTSGTAEVDIDPTEDTIDEGTGETIVLAGSATGFAPATATVTITDNDTASPISLSTSPSSIDEDGSATPVTVTATLPAGVTRSTDTVVTLNSTLAGTATGGGTDYSHSGLPASVTITAGSASGSATGLSIDPTDNDEAATDKTIIVNGSLTGYTVNSATITLADDEDPEITLRSERVGDGDDGSVDEGDSATFRITVTGYRLQRRTAEGVWANVATPAVGAVAHINRGLRYSTEYVWRLYASNEDGEGPASNEVTLTTGSRPPPSLGGPPIGGQGPGEPAPGPSEPEPSSQAHRFTDVDPDSVLAPGIERAASLGLMSAVEGDRFEPTRLMTRLEVAPPLVNLWRALGGSCPDGAPMPFSDVPAGSSARDVACLHAEGIVAGTTASTYSPDQVLNRAQAMTLLARIWQLDGNDCPEEAPNPFTDVADNSVHRDDIVCMHALGVTAGTTATTFSPNRRLTRAQVAVLVARLHDAVEPSSTRTSSGPPDSGADEGADGGRSDEGGSESRPAMTRADMAAPLLSLWQALGERCPRVVRMPFRDLPVGTQVRADVACLHTVGIVAGTSPVRYSPDQAVTRAQTAALLARVWQLSGRRCPARATNVFTDVADDSVHRDGIVCMHALGVTAGTTATTFSPNQPITPAQFAALAARLQEAA